MDRLRSRQSSFRRPCGYALVAGVTVFLGLGCWSVSAPQAALITYTDAAAFSAALPSVQSVLDFDALAGGDAADFGDTIADGGTLGGITFNYPVLAGFGVTLEVRKDFDTTSGPNSLGTDDGGVFQGGDVLDLSFAPVNALGMFFTLAPDPLFDDDIVLAAGGGSVGLVVADLQQTLPDGGLVYFLGLIDDMNTFSSAILGGSGPFFVYTIDDITTAVIAEPGSLSLFGLGLVGLLVAARRRRRGA